MWVRWELAKELRRKRSKEAYWGFCATALYCQAWDSYLYVNSIHFPMLYLSEPDPSCRRWHVKHMRIQGSLWQCHETFWDHDTHQDLPKCYTIYLFSQVTALYVATGMAKLGWGSSSCVAHIYFSVCAISLICLNKSFSHSHTWSMSLSLNSSLILRK